MKISYCSRRPILQPCDLPDYTYQIDPYVGCGHYCYYCYVLDQAETDWRKEIRMHRDITARLEDELQGISPQRIYMGWHTDPYQPCEADLNQTRAVLKILSARGFSASILTKSDLFVRDADILRTMPEPSLSVSVSMSDEKVRGLFEANTKDTIDRINALAKLKARGVRTASLICPVIPYISDPFNLIDMLAPHTEKIWIYGLSMADKNHPGWRNVAGILDEHFPELKAKVKATVFNGDDPFWLELRGSLERVKEERGLDLAIRV